MAYATKQELINTTLIIYIIVLGDYSVPPDLINIQHISSYTYLSGKAFVYKLIEERKNTY